MKAQVTHQNVNESIVLFQTAIKGWSNMEGFGDMNSHKAKGTKFYNTTKRFHVTRYQREYEIEFCFDDNGAVEIWAVDGNSDVEDTYSESFLKDIEDKIIIMSQDNDNDEEYDNHFQNHEVL